MELEKIAIQDEYFVKRSLYPNVDFYSGIVLRALGIPVSMYTVLFAMARTVGWVAQWKEMVGEPMQRITRPRQIYTGHLRRKYIPVYERQLSGKIALPDKGVVEGGFRSSLMSRLVSADARPAGR